ncbi:MAG: ATP-binding protein [bacterium]|nr:ATP-binding protein [bacterium]
METDPDLPVLVGDRDALATAVLNLLDNAWKYTGEKKLIRLKTYAESGHVCFAVSDDGVGISPREASRIFDRFYQVDRRLSRGGGGCGLGLSIVQLIVRAHGGEVVVTSRPGRGSTFTLRLPAGEAEEYPL